MLTEDEFRDALSAHFARTGKVYWAVVAGGFVPFAGACCVRNQFLFAVAVCGWIGAMTIMVAYFAWWDLRPSRSDARLTCPDCGRPLHHRYNVVLATGNCAYCRWPVLARRGSDKKPPWPDPEL